MMKQGKKAKKPAMPPISDDASLPCFTDNVDSKSSNAESGGQDEGLLEISKKEIEDELIAKGYYPKLVRKMDIKVLKIMLQESQKGSGEYADDLLDENGEYLKQSQKFKIDQKNSNFNKKSKKYFLDSTDDDNESGDENDKESSNVNGYNCFNKLDYAFDGESFDTNGNISNETDGNIDTLTTLSFKK